MAPEVSAHPASFRDPDGFVFTRGGVLLRQVNESGRADYERLVQSGLYARLLGEGLIVPHEEVGPAAAAVPGAFQVIKPRLVPFVSHPWEWCFSQLKDAALLTLRVAREAAAFGMTTKDASAFNVQFVGCRPVFIDTLSFARQEEGAPWDGYRQFCQHFLAPLALMALRDARLGRLLQLHLDGVPLDLASRLLPLRSRFSFTLLAHLHLHARAQRRYADSARAGRRGTVSQRGRLGLLDNLDSAVRALSWRPPLTAWSDYGTRDSYSETAAGEKQRLVAAYLEQVAPGLVLDLGANTGVFSRLAARRAACVVSCDADDAAVEKNYLAGRGGGEERLLPLVVDLANPGPACGWAGEERAAFLGRGRADAVLALALIHHLAIAGNVPLPKVADLFSRLGETLIVEFVPKEDPQVRRLLATRRDIFPAYTREGFEEAFGSRFRVRRREAVGDGQRVLYLMTRVSPG